MTHEEIRARLILYAAAEDIPFEDAEGDLIECSDDNEFFAALTKDANAMADRLLAAHLEITKPLRDAADEMEKALLWISLNDWGWSGGGLELRNLGLCALKARKTLGLPLNAKPGWPHKNGEEEELRAVLARYRAVKGEE